MAVHTELIAATVIDGDGDSLEVRDSAVYLELERPIVVSMLNEPRTGLVYLTVDELETFGEACIAIAATKRRRSGS